MRTLRFFLVLLLFGWASAASAEIEIAFYSKDFASTFPHAYVRLTGTDESGKTIDTNYGFTPTALGPGILFGSVKGMIQTVDPVYVSRSDRHFSLKLSHEQYRQVLAVVDKWGNAKQPSYKLNGRNCVDFVADVAKTLGLSAPVIPKLMKKPKSYLTTITEMNAALIAAWTRPLGIAADAPPAPPAAANSNSPAQSAARQSPPQH
jgi:hypothetical protein